MNIHATNFLACARVIGPDSLYCGKWGNFLKAYSDLDLDPTMFNIDLFRDIFIILLCIPIFMFLEGFLFELSCKRTHTHTYTQRDSDEHSIVAYSKNASINMT